MSRSFVQGKKSIDSILRLYQKLSRQKGRDVFARKVIYEDFCIPCDGTFDVPRPGATRIFQYDKNTHNIEASPIASILHGPLLGSQAKWRIHGTFVKAMEVFQITTAQSR